MLHRQKRPLRGNKGILMASEIVESNSTQGQESSKQGVTRSKLIQRLLSQTSNLPAFLTDLVTTQAVVVAGTEAAGFVIEKSAEVFSLRPVAHVRHDESSPETRAAAVSAFQDIVKPCITQNKDGAIELSAGEDGEESQYCLVTLLRTEGEIVAASAVITRCRNVERARQRLMSMQLVAGYFELYTLRKTSDQARMIAQSHQHVLQLATAVATAQGFDAASMNLCNELASRTGATRVSIGWLKGRLIKVKALSHTEKFDKKQELIVQLEKVMEECFDQEEMVQYDPDGPCTENVTRAAQELSRTQGNAVVLSLPLRRQSEISGVVTLEFKNGHKLGPQAATGLAVAVDLLAPQLYDRYQNDRWLITKAGISTRETAKLAIGPKHMLAKTVIILGIAALAVLIFYKPMYRVKAGFEFTPVAKRIVSVPYDGIIKKVYVKPADQVKTGDLLVEMDTTDLTLEWTRALATAASHDAEMKKYLADPDSSKLAEYNIAKAKKEEAEVDAKIARSQIDQGHIRAALDGQILRGEWEDKEGARVSKGDVLMEMAEKSNLRAELAVNERDVNDVKVGSVGELATNTQPGKSHKFKVELVPAQGEPSEGTNVFKVKVALDKIDPYWQPGLIGEARVDVEPRRLIWIWTHRLVDFVRLKLWW
jgi:hypothetical protein